MEALTYSTVALTLGLVVARPRVGPRLRISPAMAALAGVALLAMVGSVRLGDVAWAAKTMWRPLLGIVAIMVMTGVARRVGVLEGMADLVFSRAKGSASRLFALVFVFGAITAAVLNNDSAVLLLTPLVVDAAKKRAPKLVVPLAFAVFLSAGIALFIVSNPMNMVVASYAGIGFNEYVARMAVPAIVGAIVTFAVARTFFRRAIAAAEVDAAAAVARVRGGTPPRSSSSSSSSSSRFGRAQVLVLVALAAVVLSYPIVSWFGGPVWVVAVCGSIALLLLGLGMGHSPQKIVREEIHLDTLLFLIAALILSIGLRHVGVVDRLAHLYDGASPAKIGVVSTLGSAILNNHPMSHLNMFALSEVNGDHRRVLAALIGGDLGPRLFPMGSLAGLLWLEMLRRSGVEIPARRFILVGAIATVPTIAVCLALI